MGILDLNDGIKFLDNGACLNKFTNKYINLVKIAKMNYCVPNLLYFDDVEYEYFYQNNFLRIDVREKIEDFVLNIRQKGEIPFFSVRCEGKGNLTKAKRLPSTVLNIGINSFEFYKSKEGLAVTDEFVKECMEIYYDRAKVYSEEKDIEKKYNFIVDEVISWIEFFYYKMMKFDSNLSHGLILQQMVFGNTDQKSGMGICCNFPDNREDDNYFRGVFLRKQQGILTKSGCWGKNEYDLADLKTINPKAYDIIYNIFLQCEEKYGENPYLEFEVVDEKVFVLQYEIRQRYVVPSEKGVKDDDLV